MIKLLDIAISVGALLVNGGFVDEAGLAPRFDVAAGEETGERG